MRPFSDLQRKPLAASRSPSTTLTEVDVSGKQSKTDWEEAEGRHQQTGLQNIPRKTRERLVSKKRPACLWKWGCLFGRATDKTGIHQRGSGMFQAGFSWRWMWWGTVCLFVWVFSTLIDPDQNGVHLSSSDTTVDQTLVPLSGSSFATHSDPSTRSLGAPWAGLKAQSFRGGAVSLKLCWYWEASPHSGSGCRANHCFPVF